MATQTYNQNTVNNSDGSGAQTTVYSPVQPLTPSGTSSMASTQPPNITPATTSTTPTIPVSTLTSTKALTLPPASTSSGVAPANAVIGYAQGLTANQQALLGSTDSGVANATDAYNTQKNNVGGLIDTYLGKSADQLSQENAAGIPGMRSDAAQLATQLSTQQLAYNAQYNAIFNDPNATMAQKANQISTLQQQHGYDLADTTIRASLAQTNYTNAQNLINHQIDIKYAPMKDAIDYGMQFLAQNKDILSAKQQQSFEANLAVQNQMYTQGVFYSQLNATTGVDFIKQAAANGADDETLQTMGSILARGGSYADVAAASNGAVQAGSFTMAFNPNSSQLEPFNTTTGRFKDGSVVSPGSSTVSGANVIKGQDGKTYNFSGYATDPTYALNVANKQQQISNNFGVVNSGDVAQHVIDAIAPGSKLTGEAVYNTAVQSGIDPSVFLAQMQQESVLGNSNVAQLNNNFGGITYAGQPGATQGSARPSSEGGFYAKFPTVQAGLDAQAAIVKRYNPPAPMGTNGDKAAALGVDALKTSAPSYLRNSIGTNINGAPYIDSSKIVDPPGSPSGTATQVANNLSKQFGIPIFSGDEATQLADANTLARNILTVVYPKWAQVAPNGMTQKLTDSTLINNLNQNSELYQNAKAFNDNSEAVAGQVKSLSGSSAKVGLIKVADQAQPNIAGFFNLGAGIDTYQSGVAKLQTTVDLANNAISSIYKAHGLPTPPPITLNSSGNIRTVPNGDGTYAVVEKQPDGSSSVLQIYKPRDPHNVST